MGIKVPENYRIYHLDKTQDISYKINKVIVLNPDKQNIDLTVKEEELKIWDSPLCFWSNKQLTAFQYSAKKKAWYIRKDKLNVLMKQLNSSQAEIET
jgi:hypothetical protein